MIERDRYCEPSCGKPQRTAVGDFVYAEHSQVAQKGLTILFVASESKDQVVKSVKKHVSNWRIGFERRFPRPGHEKAFLEGGEYGARLALSSAEEAHAIQESCDAYQGGARFMPYMNVRKSEFKGRLQKTEFEIFHFSGHCNQIYGLSLYPDEGMRAVEMRDVHIAQSEFVESFRCLGRKVDIAFIASCRSESFARALVDEDLASVAIGTKNNVKDPVIVNFVREFYRKLLSRGYMSDTQSLVIAAQQAFSSASMIVMRHDCDVCIFPEPVVVKGRSVGVYRAMSTTSCLFANKGVGLPKDYQEEFDKR